jgi:hypothetical protein
MPPQDLVNGALLHALQGLHRLARRHDETALPFPGRPQQIELRIMEAIEELAHRTWRWKLKTQPPAAGPLRSAIAACLPDGFLPPTGAARSLPHTRAAPVFYHPNSRRRARWGIRGAQGKPTLDRQRRWSWVGIGQEAEASRDQEDPLSAFTPLFPWITRNAFLSSRSNAVDNKKARRHLLFRTCDKKRRKHVVFIRANGYFCAVMFSNNTGSAEGTATVNP